MERKKREHIKYTVVTYKEFTSTPEMNYFQAECTKKQLEKNEPNEIHRIKPIGVPLQEAKS